MNWFSMLQRLGVNVDDPKYLQGKTILANRFALVLAMIFAFYAVVSLLVLPALLWSTLCSVFVFASVLLFNFLQLRTFARLILSSAFALICMLLHATVINTSEDVLAGYIALQVAALGVPWIAFDTREGFPLWISTLLNLFCLLSFQSAHGWITTDILLTPEDRGSIDFYLMLTGAGILLYGLYLLQSVTQTTEKENQLMLEEMQAKELQAQESEQKMNNYIAEIEKTREEDKKRQWASDGLAKFTDLIRSQDNVKQLGDDIISQLVKYVGANQGGLFILRDDAQDPYLELVACYAYNRKKHVEKKVAIGEGLVGQAYLEKDRIYLTDVPDHYVRITSGLGDANPRSILIVPLKLNEAVLGVIEIASFKPFEPYQLEFIDKLSESIASVISNARVNETTRKLLEESQQQSEEMRAQEEEMRQNLEELQATQEEMMRKQNENLRLLEEAQIREQQLQEQTREIERMKEEEKKKMEDLQNRQRNYVQMIMTKGKQKEEELLAQLKEKEELINQLQSNHAHN